MKTGTSVEKITAVASSVQIRADRDRLAADLLALGVRQGRDILVHVALSRLRPLFHKPRTLLSALIAAAGPSTSVLVPTHTSHNSLTSPSYRSDTAGLSPEHVARYQAHMPGFDLDMPSYGMGAFAEYIRHLRGARRSGHPQTSFAAAGPGAERLTAVHDLESHLGERSPMGALEASDGSVLLLGVGFSACTVLHLAEYRLVPEARRRPFTCFVQSSQGRRRLDFIGLDHDDSDFEALGADLVRQPFMRVGRVWGAAAIVGPARAMVDFAGQWFVSHRRGYVDSGMVGIGRHEHPA